MSLSHTESPYKLGAQRGLYLGLYLAVVFFVSVFALHAPLLSLLFLAMLAFVPVMIFRWQRRTFIDEGGESLFSSLCLQGMATFACGALISGFVAAVYFKLFQPGYVSDILDAAIENYKALGDSGVEAAEQLQTIADSGALPTIMAVVIEMIWIIIVFGSFVSMITALLARNSKIAKKTV